MDTLEVLLRQHEFLADLGTDHIRFLAGCARNVHFNAGDYLIREGAEADILYLLREGRVWLEVNVPSHGIVMLESLGVGDILGLSWLFPPYRWYLDARAAEAVRAIAFDAVCLRKKMDADHDLGYAIAKRLLHHIYLRLERVRMQRLDVYLAEAAAP